MEWKAYAPPYEWFYLPWPMLIRDNRMNSLGVRFANKLCCLEGFGSLIGLVTCPDVVRNREVVLYVDNAGFVAVYKKKHSSCPYSYTMAKAIHDIGVGLGVILQCIGWG